MNDSVSHALSGFGEKIIDYAPSLFSGLVMMVIGWFLGWLAKRLVIRLSVILHLERTLQRFRWGEAFSKADVRYAFFDTLGNLAFLVVFLVFLNDALVLMKISVLSRLLEKGVTLIPRLIIALFVFGIGMIVSGRVALAIQSGLKKEGVARSSLAARFSKAVLLLFFSAMALIEIDIAPTLVLIGFTVTLVTLAVLAVLLTWIHRSELEGSSPRSDTLPPEKEDENASPGP